MEWRDSLHIPTFDHVVTFTCVISGLFVGCPLPHPVSLPHNSALPRPPLPRLYCAVTLRQPVAVSPLIPRRIHLVINPSLPHRFLSLTQWRRSRRGIGGSCPSRPQVTWTVPPRAPGPVRYERHSTSTKCPNQINHQKLSRYMLFVHFPFKSRCTYISM